MRTLGTRTANARNASTAGAGEPAVGERAALAAGSFIPDPGKSSCGM